jgi:hypothetical protein
VRMTMGTGNKTRKTAVAGAPVAATEKIISKALLSRSEEKYAAAVRELIELCADEIAEGLTEGGGALTLSTPQDKASTTRQLA